MSVAEGTLPLGELGVLLVGALGVAAAGADGSEPALLQPAMAIKTLNATKVRIPAILGWDRPVAVTRITGWR